MPKLGLLIAAFLVSAQMYGMETSGQIKKVISDDEGIKVIFDSISETEATKRQELGSAWIFRRALKDNMKYKSWEDIIKDPKGTILYLVAMGLIKLLAERE